MIPTPLFWRQEYADLHFNHHEIINLGSAVIAVGSTDSSTVKSPGRATFGGIWSDFALTQEEYSQSLIDLMETFPSASFLQLSLPPEYFYPDIFEPQNFFMSKKSINRYFEFNYHIKINSEIKLSKGNKKKQRQFIEAGGIVRKANPRSWKEIFNLLSENRLRRGVNLSMAWETFEKSLLVLPNSFQLWQAEIGGIIIGAALTVKIDEKILYVLFWGDSIEGREVSVVASISKHLIEYCEINSINILDLGISSTQGKLDENLARFKSNLGAIETKKLICTVALK